MYEVNAEFDPLAEFPHPVQAFIIRINASFAWDDNL